MKKQFAVIALAASVFATAYAGDRIGNGGDVIVCPDRSTEVLDLYQGREDWSFEPVVHEGTRAEVITKTLSKFSLVDSYLAAKLSRRALEIEKELTVLEAGGNNSKLVKLTKNGLVNISDEGVAELPDDCEIVQAATQNQNPFPGESKFTFQKKTWLSLSPAVQASLILHEVVYEHMISVGEFPSRSTRYFNAALHAGQLDTVKGYFDISSLFGFKNLAIREDATLRRFGAKGLCTIKQQWSTVGDYPRGGTTIMVGRRNVLTHEEYFVKAVTLFWERYATHGACD